MTRPLLHYLSWGQLSVVLFAGFSFVFLLEPSFCSEKLVEIRVHTLMPVQVAVSNSARVSLFLWAGKTLLKNRNFSGGARTLRRVPMKGRHRFPAPERKFAKSKGPLTGRGVVGDTNPVLSTVGRLQSIRFNPVRWTLLSFPLRWRALLHRIPLLISSQVSLVLACFVGYTHPAGFQPDFGLVRPALPPIAALTHSNDEGVLRNTLAALALVLPVVPEKYESCYC